MTNNRIIDITDTHVVFKYRDHMDHANTKTMKILGEEFIRKFCTTYYLKIMLR